MNRIILGFVILVIGFTMVWKTDVYYRLIGYIPFAERMFMGGSRFFLKLLGIVLTLVGALVIANLQGALLEQTLGRIFIAR